MHPINCTQEIPNIDSSNSYTPAASYRFRPWIPGMMLLAVIAVVSLLGSTDKPSDDINWLSQLAKGGDSNAQLQLGLDYRDGRLGLSPDAATGLTWLRQAAEQGNAFAEDAVGSMYANGNGTKKNPALAMYWWQKGMNDGSHEARLHLSEALIQAGKVQQAEALLR